MQPSKKNVCLYIGKTTNIRNRISGHLKLGTQNIWTKGNRNSGRKPNTISQLRVGVERVFGEKALFEEDILNSIGITWIVLDGYENSVLRFYLEDQLIGKYLPLFNVDIER